MMTEITNILTAEDKSEERVQEAVVALTELKRSLTIVNDMLPAYDQRRYKEVCLSSHYYSVITLLILCYCIANQVSRGFT